MPNIMMPVGEQNFEILRQNECYYVDKTNFIAQLLQDKFKVNLITRPRHFGKTLTMSMLKNYFDIRKDSRKIFAGLAIMSHKEFCKKWMNQYPVLSLSFKDILKDEFEDCYRQLAFIISNLCIEHDYLIKSDKVNISDRNCFIRLTERTATKIEVENSLFMLTRMLYMHYGKPAILLIDEYDVSLSKASECGYYPKMLNVIRNILSTTLKTNDFLQFAVVTGCSRSTKESIFTGANNYVMNSIYDGNYMDVFGFTEEEVRQLLIDANLEEHIHEMRSWYDGYHFGKYHIYCPWDVVNHTAALMRNPEKKPGNYWKDTTHNDIIKKFIGKENLEVNDKFEVLLSGGHIKTRLKKELTYDFTAATEEDFWNLLYFTGYLSSIKAEELSQHDFSCSDEIFLEIPNERIKNILRDTIVDWFKKIL